MKKEQKTKKIDAKKVFFGLVLAFLVFVVCFAILEVGARAFIDLPTSQEFRWVMHAGINPFLIFGPQSDRVLPQKHAEDVFYNSQGFRMNELLPVEKPEEEYRLFAVGGSTTQNTGNEKGLHYCGIANELLDDETFLDKKLHCINTGQSGYTTAHSLIRIQFDLLEFEPDAITLMHNVNDLTVNFHKSDLSYSNYASKYLSTSHAPGLSIHRLSIFKKSVALRFLYNSYQNFRNSIGVKKTVEKTDVKCSEDKVIKDVELLAKDTFRNNLIAIAEITKAHDIDTIFITQPAHFSDEYYTQLCYSRNTIPSKKDYEAAFNEYNDIIRDVADEHDILLLDMQEEFADQPELFIDLVHYSEEGVKKFGEIYAEFIEFELAD